jgi:putative heme-binding domain-containing protein
MKLATSLVALMVTGGLARAAEKLDYAAAESGLKVVRLDSAKTASFLAVRVDTAGRLFVGGREELFVYEPDNKGGYRPRRRLFRFPRDTWVNDIAVRGNDLYVLTVSALYLIPGGVTRREGLRPRRFLWGVPLGHVHQCFHGLAWGPEGDLYISMGDPTPGYGDFTRPDHWCHWTFISGPGNTKTPYTGVGGVFRCRPDGSRLQVVARGTRNSVGLAFDHHWNLFTNDNDHESIPSLYVPGRLLHVTPHADFSWPRGWMPFKTPRRADLLETMFNGMGRAVPVGQAYYHDTYLPRKYRDNLLVARWGIRAVTRYPLRHRGASFKAQEFKLLVGRNQARPVGVAVGRGGRVFVTIAYMAHNEGSPIYRSDLVMITRTDDRATHPFDAYEATKVAPAKLWAELSDPSWSRRHRAHTELLRRGDSLLKEAARRLARAKAADPALPHLIWLAAAGGGPDAARLLTKLAHAKDDLVRLQAVRVLAEFPSLKAADEVFIKALSDPNAQVRLAALLALFPRQTPRVKEVIRGPARSKDTYLRQAAALYLAEKAPLPRLQKLARSRDVPTRLAAVLAAGFRLTVPPATAPLPGHLPLDPLPPSATVIQFADAKIDLRKYGRIGYFTMAEHWKAGKHSAEQEKLFGFLKGMLGDGDEQVRLQAAHFLFLLKDPRSEPLIARVRKRSEERRLGSTPIQSVPRVWVVGPFPDGKKGLAAVHPPERGVIDLTAGYPVGKKKLTWKEMSQGSYYNLSKRFGKCDHSSFYAYGRLESAGRQRVLLLVGSDDGVKVWHNGKVVWTNAAVRSALPFQDVVVLDLQPGANDVLVRVNNVTGDCGLYLHFRALAPVVARLPEKLGSAMLAERLKAAARSGGNKISPEFLKVDWVKEAARGDARKGRKLFGNLACTKCHAIRADIAVTGGPSLAGAGKRFTIPYLVESILLPDKQVSPVFRATYIETKAGKVYKGLVVAETAEKVELLLSDATRPALRKKDIAVRKLLKTSPMPQGLVKTPAELRDLLAYLLSDKPKPP